MLENHLFGSGQSHWGQGTICGQDSFPASNGAVRERNQKPLCQTLRIEQLRPNASELDSELV